MTPDLRDPIWQSIGAVIAFIGVLAAVIVYLLQRSRKSLAYQVISNTKILTVDEEYRGKIELTYEGTPVKNVNLCLLKLVNDGNVPVTSTDYERPLSFWFGDNCQILTAEIVNQSPETLKLQSRHDATRFYLEPLLLNRKDSLTVKLLIAQYDSIVEPDARIIGIREVRKVKDRSLLTSAILFVVLSVVGVIFAIGVWNASPSWDSGFMFVGAMFLVAAGLSFLIGYLQERRRLNSDS